MNKVFEDVYLGWKPKTSEDVFLIGVINDKQGKVTFKYILDEVNKASRNGFNAYFEFPDLNKVYNQYVLEIFSQRLTPKSRFKTASVFKFWEISEDILDDKLAVIAFTQAMLPTDSFEFIADFLPIKGLSFITDLSSSEIMDFPKGLLENDDYLTWESRKFDDSLDDQIIIKCDNKKLGFVKKVHSNIFKKYEGNIRLKVHSFETRETIKRVFMKVELL